MHDPAYRTTDLVLASVLSLEGMEVSLELDSRTGKVTFVIVDPEGQHTVVREIAGDVAACRSNVEPLAFARAMAAVRNMMYRFLEEHGKREPRTRAS